MKKNRLTTLALAALLAACANQAGKEGGPGTPGSGVDRQSFDDGVRAQDDFFHHANGKWLATTEIPADKALWGGLYSLDDAALDAMHTVVDEAQKDSKAEAGSDTRKLNDFYASFMDEARLETLGMQPLRSMLAKVDGLKNRKDLPALLAELNRIGVTTPFQVSVEVDRMDSTKYLLQLYQSGLGLPDRDYYLETKDEQLSDVRNKYQSHVETMLGMIDDRTAARDAKAIVALETTLAKAQWSKVQNRDPVKTYHKQELATLTMMSPGFDWKKYFAAATIAGRTNAVNVSQPSYFSQLATIAEKTPLPVWKAYLRWHLLSDYAPYLSKSFVDQSFSFYGTVVRGVPQNEVRWKRGVELLDQDIGEALGRLYVARYFPPESKARMQQLVGNLLTAYRQDIDGLDWMGADTKKQAQAKIDKLTTKIGYPDKWRDYSALNVVADDLVGNVMRAERFEYERQLNHLGQPVDRSEWGMTPQTVNAYYRADLNEIVFPAAILQPPMFRASADDAVNYGGIGLVIGHEISHGFDDKGSQFDADGNLRNWWTKADHKQFDSRTGALVDRYSDFSPVAGYPINGKLTLGENIADNAGLAIAYKAYRLSLNGKEAPVMDGLSGDQRFFYGFAQAWGVHVRDAEAIRRVKTDPHSPPQFRVNVPLMNFTPFYTAFDLKPGDKMYLPPEQRVQIW
jgi:predicted metalloendopeptidase